MKIKTILRYRDKGDKKLYLEESLREVSDARGQELINTGFAVAIDIADDETTKELKAKIEELEKVITEKDKAIADFKKIVKK